MSEYLCNVKICGRYMCKSKFYSSCHSFLLSLLLNQPSDEFETIQVTGYLFLPFPITMGIWLMQCEYKTRDNGGIFVTECNMLNKSSLFSRNSWRVMYTYGVSCNIDAQMPLKYRSDAALILLRRRSDAAHMLLSFPKRALRCCSDAVWVQNLWQWWHLRDWV